jgi:hypothetical protein
MKFSHGVFAVAATLAFAGGFASTPATAASSNDHAIAKHGVTTSQTANDTDVSARRRHWRGYRYVRPYAYPYSYGYYRPRPHYYRPYGYYGRPAPFFSFGFGPRYYW